MAMRHLLVVVLACLGLGCVGGSAGANAWRTELMFQGQPDQPVDYPCRAGLDCLSASRSFYGGAARVGFERPEKWSGLVTAAVGHAEDYEQLPVGGFGVASVRVDFQLELGRRARTFGAALRASQVLAIGWTDDTTAFRTDFPGFAVLLGRTDLWGEVGIPTLPTQIDPRLFYAEVGWATDRFRLEGGVATFGSLGFSGGEIDRASKSFGAWVAGRWAFAGPWELNGQVAITYPCVVAVGIGYHWSGE